MRDFLQQAKYQQYLKSYLCEAQASLADSVSAWIAVERFKETSSAETLKSRAPGIFKNFIKGKNTGIDDDEVVAIAKKIDENKISRQLFDTGMQQIVEKINFAWRISRHPRYLQNSKWICTVLPQRKQD